MLLQVLDDGRLTDGQGRVVSFKNAIIIMTSNVGSQYILEATKTGDKASMKDAVDKALHASFKPEFLNRIDDIVTFNSLGLDDIEKIVDIQLEEVRERLLRDRITMKVTPGAMESLALGGLDPVFGARPLRRLIQNKVVDGIANLIIDGKLGENDVVLVDATDDGEISVSRDAEASAAAHDAPAGDDSPVEPDSVE